MGASAGPALCKEERAGLEGESVSVDVLWDGWIYDGPGAGLTINFAGGALDLKPATATSSDVGPVDVDGLLTMPSGTPRAGATLCVDEATLPVCDGTGSDECPYLPRFIFELAKLSTSPDGECPGTPIAGKLVGCMVATSEWSAPFPPASARRAGDEGRSAAVRPRVQSFRTQRKTVPPS